MFSKKERDRIFKHVKIDPVTKCWNWTSGYLSDGYGRIYWRGHRYKAHRLFYEWKYGLIEKWVNKMSKEIDHLCDNRSCVNPKHLKLVSNRENVLRGKSVSALNSKKTKCIHGHDSLYQVGGRRRCRKCRQILDASQKRNQWRRQWRASRSIYSKT